MSVRPVDAQRSFYHTYYLCGDLFGSANRYRLFREKIWPRLLELAPKLEALYCAQNGRPPIDPVLLCGVTLLQFMEKGGRGWGRIFTFDISSSRLGAPVIFD